jgi:hypothetical protein
MRILKYGRTIFQTNFFIKKRPNQSLKLTEPAVSFSPRARKFFKEITMSAARIVYMELAARRRSLAPVR